MHGGSHTVSRLSLTAHSTLTVSATWSRCRCTAATSVSQARGWSSPCCLASWNALSHRGKLSDGDVQLCIDRSWQETVPGAICRRTASSSTTHGPSYMTRDAQSDHVVHGKPSDKRWGAWRAAAGTLNLPPLSHTHGDTPPSSLTTCLSIDVQPLCRPPGLLDCHGHPARLLHASPMSLPRCACTGMTRLLRRGQQCWLASTADDAWQLPLCNGEHG